MLQNRYAGRLIVVEGIDGSGKSTQLALLSQWLRAQGYAVAFSEWNSSPLVRETTRRGKKKEMFTPTTFSLIHATDFADRHGELHSAAGQEPARWCARTAMPTPPSRATWRAA